MTAPTLESWIASNGLSQELGSIFMMVADCGIEISLALRSVAVSGETGPTDNVNVQGEVQKPLDVISNEIFLRRGAATGVLSVMVSEELDEISVVENAPASAHHALVFDPLDGSSNLDVNGAVGSIFSVLDVGKSADLETSDVLQAGNKQVAAGYVLYGPATVLVLTTGKSVTMFTLDEARAEFVLTRENIAIPADTAEYAINASRRGKWYPATRRYIDDCLAGKEGPLGKAYNMRWCAAMVADLHRVLCRGGVFLYPEDEGTKDKGGRLRLLYEGNPMSMIVEAAGGASSTGLQRIMDVAPTSLHQRIGVIMGSRNEVNRIVSYYSSAE